jgi:hypothetical protein
MTSVSLGFENWNNESDVLLKDLGNIAAYTAINSAVKIGKRSTLREPENIPEPALILEGVFGILAGAVEWLRWYGFTAVEVEERVKAQKRQNLDREDQRVLTAAQPYIDHISDPQNLILRALSAETKPQLGIRD